MADSQTPQSDNDKTTKTTKKVTKPRKPKAEASSSKASTSNKSKQVSVEVEASSSRAKNQKEKTVEEVYQKKTQLEHILLRPDTYVGSVQASTEKLWIYDSDKRIMVHRELTYVPGLYKIIDEIS